MPTVNIVDESFDKIDYKQSALLPGEYENCKFSNCDFSETDLSGIILVDCEFVDCNLSLVKLSKTAIRDVTFTGCKMLGLRFDQCNPFGLSFQLERCSLNHSSFYNTKLTKTIFRDVQLQEVDFSGSDFSGSTFDRCDFALATFDNAVLEKADFRTAFNYSINPTINKIRKARFSSTGLSGLLDQFDIQIS